ncbi:MAG: type III glutamate--ammonia ligase [Pseudomonadota bacterium]
MMTDLAAWASERGVKFFLCNFTDLFGVQRAKLVPTEAIAGAQKKGAGFAGFAAWLDMTPAHPDVLVMPDPDSVIQLPWKPELAWVAGDPWMDGKPVEQAPRIVLKNLVSKASDMGYMLQSGVEPEFHLINADGSDISDDRDTQEKPCYDQSALMRRYEVIAEICSTMMSLGWGPYQNDHEDANGQFEINWDFGPCLQTADQHAFFKFMVKEIAEKHGFRATFMPKPFTHLTGNGCHVHHSLWTTDGKTCVFDGDDDLGLSEVAYHFLGGLMSHGQGMCAITNPTVNSYKRINAPATLSGATWSPQSVTYGGNNRTHMVRIPDAGRMELRLADGASNPYLLQAVLLASGLDGIERKLDPGKRLDLNMYTESHKVRGAKKLPLNMLDALRDFAKDKTLSNAMGGEFSAAYLKLRHREWAQYCQHLTQWERETTLDC